MADKLEGSAIVANTVSGDRIVTGSITTTQLAPSVASFVNAGQPLKIQTITYPGDDTAANTGGGQTIILSGSGFKQNVQVYINSNAVPSVTYANANAISFTTPALTAATYPVYVINTDDGATAILIPGIQYSGTPTWTTTTPLTTQDASIAWNIQLVATSDSAVSYSLQAGSSLPAGITLAANGLISGTMSSPPTDETTYNFTVVANDLEQQDASRAFSVSVTVVALDPFFTYTTLLLHGDGTNNANNHAFVDSSNNNFAITRNGNATQGTFSPFGDNWSVYFDGTGDYLVAGTSTNLALGSGDFTIETFIFLTAINVNGVTVWDYRTSGNAPAGIPAFFINSSRVPIYYTGDGSNFTAIITGSAAVSLNMWNHIALVRSGSTVTMYLNGVSIGSATQSTNLGIQTFSINDPQGTFGGMGYISNFRIVKGTALYTSAFNSPTQPLTSVSNTSLLTCQSNAFVDKGPNRFAITRNGDVKVSKFDPFKPYKAIPASYGVYFDGTGDYLSATSASAFAFGTGDFTVEMWLYLLAYSGDQTTVFASTLDFSSYTAMNINVQTDGKVNNGARAGTTTTNAVPLGAWTHVLIARSGTTAKIFINGVEGVSYTDNNNYTSNGCYIGVRYGAGTFFGTTTGHISNLRVLKGTALYTGNFTPPTSPLTAIANTQLLTCQSTTIIDNSTNAFTITRNGDARPTDLNPFTTTFVSEKYNTANGGGAVYFDGTGDYLNIGSGSNNVALSGDFCIEAWVYRNSNADGTIIGNYNSSPNRGWSLRTYSSTNLYLYFQIDGGAETIYTTSSDSLPIYQWNHVVWCRSGTNTSVFVNGVRVDNRTLSGASTGNGGLSISALSQSRGDINLNGYVSSARVVNGNSVYDPAQTGIIVPTSPLSVVANTAALLNFTNAGILDSVGKNVLEAVGDARVNTSIKKFGTGSMYFDGSGDYIKIPSSDLLNFGTGDFTIEFWVRTSSFDINTYYRRMVCFGEDAANNLQLLFFNGSVASSALSLYSSSLLINGTIVVADGNWHHIALCRTGTAVQLFVDGTQSGATATSSQNFNAGASNGMFIGRYALDGGYLNGHLDDLRITKGVGRYRYNFTPPTKTFNDGDGSLANNTTDVLVGDQVNTPVFPYTTLLLHGDGTNNANNHAFVDSSNNNFAITRNGNATQGTFSPFSPTGWSAYFDGSGDYVSFGDVLDIGSSNFTFECFVNFSSFASGSYNAIFTKYGADYQYQLLWDVANNRWFWNINSTVSGNSTVYYNDSLRVGEWYHLAFIKNGTSYSLYRNGVLIGTQTISGDIAGGTRPFTLGMTFGGSNNALYPFHGYISNFRALVGTILYTSNFTPPTTPLTAIANTQLLTVQSNRFIDNSTNAYSPTITGDTSIQAFSPFAPSVEYTANTHGGSAYFDGTGDYITVPDNAAFTLGTGDFTVDCWVYHSTTSSRRFICGQGNSSGQNVSIPFSVYKNSSNKLQFDVFATGSGTQYSATSTADVPINQWVHIAAVRDGGTTRIYINGVQDGTNGTVSTTTLVDSSNFFSLGSLGEYTSTDLWQGYISNFRFIKGTCLYPSGTTFTVPAAPTTAVANTQLLYNFTNAGILDSTGKNILETVGDAKVNTAIKKYGTGSMYFDGTGDYLVTPSTAVNTLAGDFTVEMWIYRSAGNNFFFTLGDSVGSTGFDVYIGNSGANLRVFSGNSVVIDNALSSINFPTSTWTHIALVRSSGSVRMYVAGMQAGSAWSSTAVFSGRVYVGAEFYNGSITGTCNGYMDDVRVTNGIARYVTNFTPPTAAFLNK